MPMEILMLFAITQNASVGMFSLFFGPIADRWGNRGALGLVVLGSAGAPILAVVLSQWSSGLGAGAYWLVYIPLGVTPLVLRILVNYTLEICPPDQHPRYLATVNLCLAMPFAFAPLVGWLVDMEAVGFRAVFSVAAVLVALGAAMTLMLEEPRKRLVDSELQVLGTSGEE